MYSQERKGISGGWKVRLQGNVNHAELQSLVRKAGAEPGLVRTLLHPCLLEEKETLALLHTSSCSASAYLWPRVLWKVRPSFSLSSSSCKGTRFVASQQCPHLPTPWRESCRARAEGLCSCCHKFLTALHRSPQQCMGESWSLQQLLRWSRGLLPVGFCLHRCRWRRKDSWLQAEEWISSFLHFLQQNSTLGIYMKEGRPVQASWTETPLKDSDSSMTKRRFDSAINQHCNSAAHAIARETDAFENSALLRVQYPFRSCMVAPWHLYWLPSDFWGWAAAPCPSLTTLTASGWRGSSQDTRRDHVIEHILKRENVRQQQGCLYCCLTLLILMIIRHFQL